MDAAETGLHRDAKEQAEQVRSVAVERVGNLIGHMPSDLMGRLDDALRLHPAIRRRAPCHSIMQPARRPQVPVRLERIRCNSGWILNSGSA